MKKGRNLELKNETSKFRPLFYAENQEFSQLFGVTLFGRKGTSKKKNQKIRIRVYHFSFSVKNGCLLILHNM